MESQWTRKVFIDPLAPALLFVLYHVIIYLVLSDLNLLLRGFCSLDGYAGLWRFNMPNTHALEGNIEPRFNYEGLQHQFTVICRIARGCTMRGRCETQVSA